MNQVGLSPLDAVCGSVERLDDVAKLSASGRSAVVLGADNSGSWRDVGQALESSGVPAETPTELIANLSAQPSVTPASLGDISATASGDADATVDSALALRFGSR